MQESKHYPWQIRFITQIGGKYSFQTVEFKTKREAVKAFPSKMTSIQKVDRTYYIMPSAGK